MTRTVKVKTGGRLHFGLTSFGGCDSGTHEYVTSRQFGGLGLMVDDAAVKLTVSAAPAFRAIGPLRQRVESFAANFAKHQQLPALPACHVHVDFAQPEHVGLGVGTQLGLAVTAGLSACCGLAYRDANLLSAMSGRGHRSAIGTHGFLQGGLLVDGGKLPGESLGRLDGRVELPEAWRFVLVRQPAAGGLAGRAEDEAISTLPSVCMSTKTELDRIIHEEILPAAENADWQIFSEALYRYGYQAGECFAPVQGGPYASESIARLVEHIRQLGYPGVGQSSWGPTLFVVAVDQQAAEFLVSQLQQAPEHASCHFAITQANNTGASIHIDP